MSVAEVVSTLLSDDGAAVTDPAVLVDPRAPREMAHVLPDILKELRLSRPEILEQRQLTPDKAREMTAHAPPGMADRVSQLELRSGFGVRGRVWVTESDRGGLAGVRLEVDPPAPMESADDVIDAFRLLDPSPALLLRTSGHDLDTGPTKDVASLAKIFILRAVLSARRDGTLDLDQTVVLTKEGLCPLSAGLTVDHVGSRLSVAELCRLMILRSDNTAADLLVEIVGELRLEDAVARGSAAAETGPPRTWAMREVIAQAWGLTFETATERARDQKVMALPPAHPSGVGFFVPLVALEAAMTEIVGHDWSPWPSAINDSTRVLYKGGSAPGVLSGLWFDPAEHASRLCVFAVNSDLSYGAMEDLYTRHCGDQLMASAPTDPHATQVNRGPR